MSEETKLEFARKMVAEQASILSPVLGGMTMREYFAGQALQGLCANAAPGIPASEYALSSVTFADSLIAALKVKP